MKAIFWNKLTDKDRQLFKSIREELNRLNPKESEVFEIRFFDVFGRFGDSPTEFLEEHLQTVRARSMAAQAKSQENNHAFSRFLSKFTGYGVFSKGLDANNYTNNPGTRSDYSHRIFNGDSKIHNNIFFDKRADKYEPNGQEDEYILRGIREELARRGYRNTKIDGYPYVGSNEQTMSRMFEFINFKKWFSLSRDDDLRKLTNKFAKYRTGGANSYMSTDRDRWLHISRDSDGILKEAFYDLRNFSVKDPFKTSGFENINFKNNVLPSYEMVDDLTEPDMERYFKYLHKFDNSWTAFSRIYESYMDNIPELVENYKIRDSWYTPAYGNKLNTKLDMTRLYSHRIIMEKQGILRILKDNFPEDWLSLNPETMHGEYRDSDYCYNIRENKKSIPTNNPFDFMGDTEYDVDGIEVPAVDTPWRLFKNFNSDNIKSLYEQTERYNVASYFVQKKMPKFVFDEDYRPDLESPETDIVKSSEVLNRYRYTKEYIHLFESIRKLHGTTGFYHNGRRFKGQRLGEDDFETFDSGWWGFLDWDYLQPVFKWWYMPVDVLNKIFYREQFKRQKYGFINDRDDSNNFGRKIIDSFKFWNGLRIYTYMVRRWYELFWKRSIFLYLHSDAESPWFYHPRVALYSRVIPETLKSLKYAAFSGNSRRPDWVSESGLTGNLIKKRPKNFGGDNFYLKHKDTQDVHFSMNDFYDYRDYLRYLRDTPRHPDFFNRKSDIDYFLNFVPKSNTNIDGLEQLSAEQTSFLNDLNIAIPDLIDVPNLETMAVGGANVASTTACAVADILQCTLFLI